jgi:hypothetical protein
MFTKSLRQSLTILSLGSVILFSASCSKEDEPSKEELIARTWVITDFLATGAGESVSVFDDEFDACDQDDQYVFAANGTITVNSGSNKCDDAELDPLASGSWSFVDGGKKISLDAPMFGSEVFDVDELTANSMKVSITDNSIGIPIKLQFVLSAR